MNASRRVNAYARLTKPGITGLVVVTAGAGFLMGSLAPPDPGRLLLTLLGTALAAGGTNALNQYAEREIDGRMARTRDRPLPSGQLRPGHGLAFAVAISAVGIGILLVGVDPVTSSLAALSLLVYIFVYTPLKRHTWTATLVGAVPGALPILGGWTAARHAGWSVLFPGAGVPTTASPDGAAAGWVLFALLFLWQLPHFHGLEWLLREEYRRAGFRTLAVADPTGRRTARHVLLSTLLLVAVSLAPGLLGLSGAVYTGGAMLLGAGLVVSATALALDAPDPSPERGRRVFLASVAYLPLLLSVMTGERLLRWIGG